MPKKIRQIKQDLRQAGFVEKSNRGKGSHVMFFHVKVRQAVTIPGKDGDDAPDYLVKQVLKKIKESQS